MMSRIFWVNSEERIRTKICTPKCQNWEKNAKSFADKKFCYIFALAIGKNSWLQSSEQCGNSSVGRAQPCQGWGREFESRFPLKIRQLLLWLSFFMSDTWRHIFAEIAQLVEHNLAKVGVASSSLVFRSQNDSLMVVVFFVSGYIVIPPEATLILKFGIYKSSEIWIMHNTTYCVVKI